jgi:hypothetical protein
MSEEPTKVKQPELQKLQHQEKGQILRVKLGRGGLQVLSVEYPVSGGTYSSESSGT